MGWGSILVHDKRTAMDTKGHKSEQKTLTTTYGATGNSVLDKALFSNVFEKDIRRVYIFKKAERIAKALHLVSPAFKDVKALRDRLERLSVSLIDAAALPVAESREALARDLLALLSFLSMARMSGRLSSMNADIISREAQGLLHDVTAYDDQRIELPEVPTLATLAKAMPTRKAPAPPYKGQDKGQQKDTVPAGNRRETVLSILKSKGPSDIKDISVVFQGVSEKTIQRELQSLVLEGKVTKTGKRRWTTYRLSEGS